MLFTVMDTLNDRVLKSGCVQQVGGDRAMSKWIDSPCRFGRHAQMGF
jgi:hypothetical protein